MYLREWEVPLIRVGIYLTLARKGLKGEAVCSVLLKRYLPIRANDGRTCGVKEHRERDK